MIRIAGFTLLLALSSASAYAQTAAVRPSTATNERVEVTAYRSPLASLDSPASTRVLSEEKLDTAAPPALDDKLRQVPGLELFRRSSSLFANPTSQGISLRGLGSTAASRTLVISNDVPLNDPYGGWIHWNEQPELTIKAAEIVRGGASDLYGSSAIGGVINLIPVTAAPRELSLLSSYGALATTDNAVLGSLKQGANSALFSAGLIGTDGYTLVAPNLRGAVDVPSNVHSENALAELDHQLSGIFGTSTSAPGRLFLRGTGFNESRHNGTPDTTNATRLWRYSAGADINHLTLRAYGSSEHYRQSFSSVAVGRATERLTRNARDPADELGAAVRWRQPVGARLLILAGADTHDVRAADYEFPTTGSPSSTTARQRQTGAYVEALATPKDWTLSASARADHFSDFDAATFAPGLTALPHFSETVVDPRVGLVRRIGPTFALNASGFRAYRAPTENELYRTGQVGQQTTLPNPNLRSERGTGWETGFETDPSRLHAVLRGSYFWTRVNRPITALTLSTTPTATTLMRENLGQIESRGVSVDASAHPASWLALEGGYQFARATVTQYVQQPLLVGKWIPQVARNAATAQATFNRPALGLISFQTRYGGRQFDDDQNHYLLHGYFLLDIYGSHTFSGAHLFGARTEVFASVENAFDRSVDVGRTPIRTLGTPQLARFGLRIHLGG
jgi:outer membrane receptor protein involved in Fe transport